LYAAVFSWTSIQVGFLFAVYTFIVPRTEPFFKAVAGTAAFEAFKKYMLASTYLTLVSALGAFILTVTNPAPGRSLVLSCLLIGWLSLTAYTLFRFMKVIRSFRKLERTRKS
jgi:cation transporter-like permease